MVFCGFLAGRTSRGRSPTEAVFHFMDREKVVLPFQAKKLEMEGKVFVD